MSKKTVSFLSFLLLWIAIPTLNAWAAFSYTPMEAIPGFAKDGNFCTYITQVYNFGLWVIGICAMFMIMIGGYMYLVSAGNNASMTKAKGIIFDAIIGLLLAFSAYLILYVINPELVQIKGICDGAASGNQPAVNGGAQPAANGGVQPSALGKLSKDCDKYDATFQAAASNQDTRCLLKAIAMAESSCNPNAKSAVGACGLMQIMPTTAGMTCAELSDSQASITKAAQLLRTNQVQINKYTDFTASKQTNPGTDTVTYGANTYSTGNDDLIASYNGGGGTTASAGKKGPFALSSDCSPPATPAWQCDKNPGGFAETQTYVQKVQGYQKQCLGS